jgi:hypothetical protein
MSLEIVGLVIGGIIILLRRSHLLEKNVERLCSCGLPAGEGGKVCND